MQQSESVEREHPHNLEGATPSRFEDVKDVELRHKNRGAVLANIYEQYTSEDERGNVQLTAKNLAMCTRDMENYLDGMSRRERAAARSAMMVHLEKRGFHAKS